MQSIIIHNSIIEKKHSNGHLLYKQFWDNLLKIWNENPAVLNDFVFVSSGSFSQLSIEFSLIDQFKNYKLVKNPYNKNLIHLIWKDNDLPLYYTHSVVGEIVSRNVKGIENAKSSIEYAENINFKLCLKTSFEKFFENNYQYWINKNEFFKKFYIDDYAEKMLQSDFEHYKKYISRFDNAEIYLNELNEDFAYEGFKVSANSKTEFKIQLIPKKINPNAQKYKEPSNSGLMMATENISESSELAKEDGSYGTHQIIDPSGGFGSFPSYDNFD